MPLIVYPFTGITGKVAGTLAMPTVIPFFERTDQIGSCFKHIRVRDDPADKKTVTPCSSGRVLVNIVE